jgi:hypothetical protein
MLGASKSMLEASKSMLGASKSMLEASKSMLGTSKHISCQVFPQIIWMKYITGIGNLLGEIRISSA